MKDPKYNVNKFRQSDFTVDPLHISKEFDEKFCKAMRAVTEPISDATDNVYVFGATVIGCITFFVYTVS